ncbi:MAG: DUF1822 family protein [Leptolyngbyaceae cyanobacterium]
MANFLDFQTDFRLLPPETIWLEPEQIEQAKYMSEPRLRESSISESQQWQSYLNALALLGFKQWLSERLPEHPIVRLLVPFGAVSYVEVRRFRVCLIAVEHVLNEFVCIPQSVVDQPVLAAHFYVVLEVSEEQALVTMRGFWRFDELINYRDHHNCQGQESYYQLPLASIDAESNHFLLYCRTVQPAAIASEASVSQKRTAESFAVPIGAATPFAERLKASPTQTTTKLTQWLQDAFDPNWQTIDQLINPEAYLALGTRNIEPVARRGKLINLGVQFEQKTVALLVNVTSEIEGKLGVLVQLHPTEDARYLIPNFKLSLRSSAGKLLQEVTSRSQDNYIQLKPFKGKTGTCFRVAIHLGDEMVEENFEL